MLWKELDIRPDYVILDDTRIPRPFYMSPSQWMEQWDSFHEGRSYDDGFYEGVESQKEYEYTEDDLINAEGSGYERAISDVRGDINNAIDVMEQELFEKIDGKLIDSLKDRFYDCVN